MKVVFAKDLKYGTWNHRVFHHVTPYEEYYAIHEVHYNEDGSLRAYGERAEVISDTIEDMRETLARMERCLDKPVLEESAFAKAQ